jgi:hypothetical protein
MVIVLGLKVVPDAPTVDATTTAVVGVAVGEFPPVPVVEPLFEQATTNQAKENKPMANKAIFFTSASKSLVTRPIDAYTHIKLITSSCQSIVLLGV